MNKPRDEADALSGFRQCVDVLLEEHGYDPEDLRGMLDDLIEEAGL